MKIDPRSIDFEDDDEEFDFKKFEPIRKTQDPVSGRHDSQRRAECGVNRHRKTLPRE